MTKFMTQKGYSFFEASSSFQKAIRRGDEDMALYFMVEFFNSGYDEYIWKRIKIITSEDVGLANPTLPATIHGLYSAYTDLKKEGKDNKPERLFLTQAVITLSRSPKSRLVDWAMIKIWREHDEKQISIPDYAYDMHNSKGKAMGRGIHHFYNEGTQLENHHPQPKETETKQQAFILHQKSPEKLSFKKPPKPKEQTGYLFGDE